MYQMTFPTIGFSSTIASLGPSVATGCASGPTSTNACVIDWNLAQATTAGAAKSGYYFAMGVTATNALNTAYTVGGAAAAFDQMGVRGFCSSEDGVIRFTPALNGPPITTNPACVLYTPLQ